MSEVLFYIIINYFFIMHNSIKNHWRLENSIFSQNLYFTYLLLIKEFIRSGQNLSDRGQKSQLFFLWEPPLGRLDHVHNLRFWFGPLEKIFISLSVSRIPIPVMYYPKKITPLRFLLCEPNQPVRRSSIVEGLVLQCIHLRWPCIVSGRRDGGYSE